VSVVRFEASLVLSSWSSPWLGYCCQKIAVSSSGIVRCPFSAPPREQRSHQPEVLSDLCLMNVLSFNSSNAIWSCWRVFMTIGPYQATGSPMGLPETRRKRTGSASVETTI